MGRYVIARDEAILIDDGRKEVLESVVGRECYKMPASCPAEVQTEAITVARDAKQRAEQSLTQLEVLVKALGSVPGPKHIVLITEGPCRPAIPWASCRRLASSRRLRA